MGGVKILIQSGDLAVLDPADDTGRQTQAFTILDPRAVQDMLLDETLWKHVDAAIQAVCEGSSWTACTIRAAITQLALPGDSILEMWLTDSLIVLGGNDIHTKYFPTGHKTDCLDLFLVAT